VINKNHINSIWKDRLEAKSIDYQRYMTSPTILNNVLWYCLAETEEGYYSGMYSIFDKDKQVELKYTPRNAALLNELPDDRTIGILKWFSNNYYNVIINDQGDIQLNDLRFGAIENNENKETYIFNFPLEKTAKGYYNLSSTRKGPPTEDRKRMLSTLWTRIKGI
jgi:inner membrane protein